MDDGTVENKARTIRRGQEQQQISTPGVGWAETVDGDADLDEERGSLSNRALPTLVPREETSGFVAPRLEPVPRGEHAVVPKAPQKVTFSLLCGVDGEHSLSSEPVIGRVTRLALVGRSLAVQRIGGPCVGQRRFPHTW